MEIFLYVIIGALLVVILVLLFRQKKVEIPAIEELESKLRFALASAASVKRALPVFTSIKSMPSSYLIPTKSIGSPK